MPHEIKGTTDPRSYGSLQSEGLKEDVQEHDVEDGSVVESVKPGIPTSRKVISALLLAGLFGVAYLTVSRPGKHPVLLDDARLSAIQGNPGLLLTPEDESNLEYTKTILEDHVASLQNELDTTKGTLAAIYQLLNPGQAPPPAGAPQAPAAPTGQAPPVDQLAATANGAGQDCNAQLKAKDLLIAQLQQQPGQQPLLQQQQQPPPPSATTFHPFTSTQELYSAVDAYVGSDMTQRIAVMSYYGSPIGSWDVSQISDFSHVFDKSRSPNCEFFNEDLSGWDVSKATTMASMFEGERYFNQDLSLWDVSHVQDFSRMFSNCKSFDKNLSFWIISNTANTQDMFKGLKDFNPSFYPRVNPVSPMFASPYLPYYTPNWSN